MWSLRYVAAGGGEGEGEELLVSVSTDGRVLSWRHTQSLDPSELMRLKRPPSQRRGATEQQVWRQAAGGGRLAVCCSGPATAPLLQGPARREPLRPASPNALAPAPMQGNTDGLLGRLAGGTCFDFSPADPRTYLVGTEEGVVHRCNTAFTEQSIQSYSGHAGPVYQVRGRTWWVV